MTATSRTEPESTAARVALWRAMHVLVDPPPHVLADEVGLKLIAPDDGWRERPDMDPSGTAPFRASIVARARFADDLVTEQAGRGVTQYVVLGAGVDTFAQRRPEIAARMTVFEVDQPGPREWKRGRLVELGYGVPDWLRLVPVDFETDGDWVKRLVKAGFDPDRPAVVVAAGVTMYLERATTAATLRQIAGFAPGSTAVMTFLLPPDLLEGADRAGLESSTTNARASKTPFVSFYRPAQMLALARDAGFADARHVPSSALAERYFAGRSDGLRPSSGEDLLLATA
jgi:methyltransferase (TIGR00027 family)